MIVLHTSRLTLRPCSPADRNDFMSLERDPEVMLFLNGGQAVDHSQNNDAANFLMPRGTEPHVWTARHKADEAFCGWFCLWPEGERTAEIGYRLRRADWGRGLATEGACALVNWGFASGTYDRVLACTMTVNHGSRRVLEKIGLKYVRTVQVDWASDIQGGEQGEVWYEMSREAP